ncbi:hypothetical protein SESBI_17704 [Sesbania bispinosa]|nr:hypothetical protein SESBI_17704 [Sesbania bispinosa]
MASTCEKENDPKKTTCSALLVVQELDSTLVAHMKTTKIRMRVFLKTPHAGFRALKTACGFLVPSGWYKANVDAAHATGDAWGFVQNQGNSVFLPSHACKGLYLLRK